MRHDLNLGRQTTFKFSGHVHVVYQCTCTVYTCGRGIRINGTEADDVMVHQYRQHSGPFTEPNYGHEQVNKKMSGSKESHLL